MRFTGPYRTSFFCRTLALLILGSFLVVAQPVHSQKREKSRLEQQNEKKNKKNRRSARRGDRGKSNKRQLRAVRAKVRSSQGDRPYRGDITGRQVRTKRSPLRPSFANYARPNPYAGKRRNSEASRAKAASRYARNQPVSATRRGERPYRTSLSGSKLRSRNTVSRRPGVYARTNPYLGKRRITETRTARRASKNVYNRRPVSISNRSRKLYNRPPTYMGMKRRTENDMSRSAANLRRRPSTATRKGEVGRTRTAGGNRLSTPRTASNLRKPFNRRPVSVYTGKKRRTEDQASRDAVRLRRRPQSGTRSGERGTNKTVDGRPIIPRTASATAKRITPQTNIYQGKRRDSERTKARRSARRYSPPVSVTARQKPPKKRKRIVPRTISSAFRVPRRKSPYGASRRIKEWEKGYAKDITGRKFRYKSPSILPPPRRPSFNPYQGRKRLGDQPYRTGRRAVVTIPSATRPSERGWRGTITGKKFTSKRSPRPTYSQRRTTPYYGKRKVGDRPYKGRLQGGYQSVTRRSEGAVRRSPFSGGRNLSVTDRYKKPGRLTGRGSMSITRSSERGQSRPRYSGGRNLSVTDKFKKPGRLQGRGSMSITRSSERGQSRPRYSGGRNLSVTDKFKKPGRLLGRGSMSITRSSEEGARRPRYSGGRNLSVTDKFKGPGKAYGRGSLSVTDKFKKPGRLIGRGSMSITRSAEDGARRPRYSGGRNLSITDKYVGRAQRAKKVRSTDTRWNNRGNPIAPRIFKNAFVSTFQGTKKAEKPLKGGGSISGSGWNNKGKPLSPRVFQNMAISKFSGTMKARKPLKGGGSISGKGWNNDGKSLTQRDISPQIYDAARFTGTMKARKPVKGGGGSISGRGWNNDGKTINQPNVSPQIYDAARFRGRFKRTDFYPVTDSDHSRYSGFFKNNELKPKLNDDYRNYSGAIKVTRRTAKDYHPSFYMHRDLQDDSMDHKKRKFSIKLIWAKVFRSNNPAKARKRAPELQFDEREQGLWYY